MRGWKRSVTAAVLLVLVLVGAWGTLLVGQRSAQTMGQATGALPRVRFGQDGSLQMSLGQREWRAEPQRVDRVLLAADRVEWMVPRSLRIAGLAALTGLWWAEQELGHAVGKKLLTGAPGPFGEEQKDVEKV